MKNKKKISMIVAVLSIILVIIGITFILDKDDDFKLANNKESLLEESNSIDESYVYSNKTSENDERTNENNTVNNEITSNEYDEQFNKLADNETNGEKEETIITIVDKTSNNNEKIEVTNKDLEFFKIMLEYGNEDATDEELKEKMLDYKIYSIEAQKLGLRLPEDRMEDIEEMTNSEEILEFVQNDKKARNKFKERVYNYLLDIEYSSVLNSKILDETSNNNISINNNELKRKAKEYIDLQNSFQPIENFTEDEKLEGMAKSYSLLMEMEEIYLKEIKDKYAIEYK